MSSLQSGAGGVRPPTVLMRWMYVVCARRSPRVPAVADSALISSHWIAVASTVSPATREPRTVLPSSARQVTVLAYQLGNGTFDLLFPTNGPLLALLAISGVRFDDWFKWALPRCLILAAFGCVALIVAIAIGWH